MIYQDLFSCRDDEYLCEDERKNLIGRVRLNKDKLPSVILSGGLYIKVSSFNDILDIITIICEFQRRPWILFEYQVTSFRESLKKFNVKLRSDNIINNTRGLFTLNAMSRLIDIMNDIAILNNNFGFKKDNDLTNILYCKKRKIDYNRNIKEIKWLAQ